MVRRRSRGRGRVARRDRRDAGDGDGYAKRLVRPRRGRVVFVRGRRRRLFFGGAGRGGSAGGVVSLRRRRRVARALLARGHRGLGAGRGRARGADQDRGGGRGGGGGGTERRRRLRRAHDVRVKKFARRIEEEAVRVFLGRRPHAGAHHHAGGGRLRAEGHPRLGGGGERVHRGGGGGGARRRARAREGFENKRNRRRPKR
mmetsp:Transcript_6482/g.27647  ORF Transcript_6482/g.27647 Transcript_6482/m.27647 type:complete len:201 (-) Transcript_6482:2250-2852(-)